MKSKDDGKVIDFSKAKEIPDFGLAGKTGKLKGDTDGVVLITQDFKDSTIAVLRFGPDGKLDSIPRIPGICVVIDSVIGTPFS